MGKKGQFDYAYNGQISVDADHQIIVFKKVERSVKTILGQAPSKRTSIALAIALWRLPKNTIKPPRP